MKVDKFIDILTKGFNFNGSKVYCKEIKKGRFIEEVVISVYFTKESEEEFLMYIKLFKGRGEFYKAWLEMYSINEFFFISVLENEFLNIINSILNEGEILYIEYIKDKETYYELNIGIPVTLSRLGFKLFKLGFYLLKDWYFPEGFFEGNPKLQAQKPLKCSALNYLKDLKKDLNNFFKSYKTWLIQLGIFDKISLRYNEIMGIIESLN